MKRGKSRQYIIILVDFGAQFKIRPKGGTYFSIAKRELKNLSLYRSTAAFSTISDNEMRRTPPCELSSAGSATSTAIFGIFSPPASVIPLQALPVAALHLSV
ncbi:hypothetical protein KY285_002843 [Solanum tuberosum]|nr:hypothetical protein KY285_002843 [Solanum tuberosum]